MSCLPIACQKLSQQAESGQIMIPLNSNGATTLPHIMTMSCTERFTSTYMKGGCSAAPVFYTIHFIHNTLVLLFPRSSVYYFTFSCYFYLWSKYYKDKHGVWVEYEWHFLGNDNVLGPITTATKLAQTSPLLSGVFSAASVIWRNGDPTVLILLSMILVVLILGIIQHLLRRLNKICIYVYSQYWVGTHDAKIPDCLSTALDHPDTRCHLHHSLQRSKVHEQPCKCIHISL